MDAQLRCDVTDHDWWHFNFITILNPWYWARLGHRDRGYQSACLNVIYPPLQMVMNYHHWRWCLAWKWKCWQNTEMHHWTERIMRRLRTKNWFFVGHLKFINKDWAPSNYQLSPEKWGIKQWLSITQHTMGLSGNLRGKYENTAHWKQLLFCCNGGVFLVKAKSSPLLDRSIICLDN